MADPFTLALAAGTALQVGSGIAGSVGEARADTFRANEAAAAARRGKIAAAETDTVMREEIASVVAGIRAIRASSGIASDSPTTAAITEREQEISDRQRRIEVTNRLEQARSDESAAKFLRSNAQNKLIFGSAAAIGGGLSSFSTSFASMKAPKV